MTDIRNSPSGPNVAVGPGGPVTTDDVTNLTVLPGQDVTESTNFFVDFVQTNLGQLQLVDQELTLRLDNLSTTEVANASSVPGATTSDALDYLLSTSGGSAGQIVETFAGGNSATVNATNTNANIGDNGWNYVVSGTATGNSVVKRAGETSAVGIYRVTSPSELFARATLYLGGAATGIFAADGWASCTFRNRVDTVPQANAFQTWGVVSNAANLLGTSESAGFLAVLAGPGSSPNYQTRTSHASAGNALKDTGVPIDGLFHDFRIERVSATQLDFYIDGVLRTTHSSPTDGIPEGPLIPMSAAVGGGATTFIDVDAFTFEPA